MRSIHLALDDKLLAAVDRVARKLGMSRSAFARDALQDALTRLRTLELERRHRDGYLRKPVTPGEFDA